MATVEHCLYCFETLAAELENRDPLSLEDVQKSYAAYLASLQQSTTSPTEDDQTTPAKKIPALRRLAAAASASASSSSSSLLASPSSSSTTSLSSANTAATTPSDSPAPQATTTTPTPTTATKVTDPTARYPLFVTWDKQQSSGEYHLRGCIGTFSADAPLSECLSEYALVSALHDHRFPRVSARELARLRCSATLLTNFEPCADVDDWVVGEHGIRISFTHAGRRLGSTYLPSVAPEQGWDREQALVSLMRKAGWERRRASWREVAEAGGMQVERYRGDKEEVEWDEYKTWRDWVSENWDEAD